MNVFSPEQLQRIVSEMLPAEVSNAHTHAVVAAVDQNGAQVVASFKQADAHWELQAAAQHKWTGENSVGARVLLSW